MAADPAFELPLLDPATWRDLQETAGADFAVELAGTFLEESPAILDELAAAHAQADGVRFQRAAHSLKSNCMTFGALRLAQRARTLELQPLAQADAAALAALRAEYEATAAALQALAHG